MRKPVWPWAIAMMGVLLAVGMRVAGATQMFKVGVELWALPLLTGAIVLVAVSVLRWRRGRNTRAVEEALLDLTQTYFRVPGARPPELPA